MVVGFSIEEGGREVLKMKGEALMIIGFMILNLMLLFERRKAWFNSNYKWYAAFTLFSIGLVLFVFFKPIDADTNLFYYAFMTPALFSLISYAFKKLSVSIQQRDFYLWLRGSSELSDVNTRFSLIDRLFSIVLLYVVLILPFWPLLVIKH